MTDFHGQVSLFDVLDSVHCVVRVYDLDRPAGPDRLALSFALGAQGLGQDDPVKWTQYALMDVVSHLEVLKEAQ